MEYVFCSTITDPAHLDGIRQLLTQYDDAFFPPITGRPSTAQAVAKGGKAGGIEAYLKSMLPTPCVMLMEGDRVAGFLSYLLNYSSWHIPEQYLPNVYIGTILIHEDFRGKKLAESVYTALAAHHPGHALCTRTWSANDAHITVLKNLGFRELLRQKDHRGPGIDTVYYIKEA